MSKKKPTRKQAQRLSLARIVEHADDQGYHTPFIATREHAEFIWEALNRGVFRGQLVRPEKFIVRDYDESKWPYWGECEGLQRGHRYGPHYTKTIRLQKRWPNFKKFITVLAHEMVHQYEWEKQGVMTHGKTFFAWEQRLRDHGIRLTVVS